MRQHRTIFLPVLLASILAIAGGAIHLMRGADAAGAVLNHASANCSAGTITLPWVPLPGVTGQRLEISVHDNGFEAGTFTRVNLPAGQTEHTMSPLARNIPNYWRIVSLSGSDEIASETKAFVPCGGPFLLWGPLECRNFTSATVRFRWAPAANFEGQQWIEFDSDGDWQGDDFWRIGPFSPASKRLDAAASSTASSTSSGSSKS